jgi:imidazolonepropionase
MLLINNIGCLATMAPEAADNKVGEDLALVNNAAMLIDEQYIFWCGEEKNMPAQKITHSIDAEQSLVIPGLIDCHSHLIFAGSRADEFACRMNGESYSAIMARGGGINSSVEATRRASDEELYNLAYARAQKILRQGVTTLEVKSGYGLSFEQEMRILRLVKKLNAEQNLELHPTFLGAHVIPGDYKNRPEEYVDLVAGPMLEKIAKERLALDCDVFCEKGAFSVKQARKILSAAQNLGLGLRAHVQQLGPSGGVSLLEELPIKSISHADFLSTQDINLIAHTHCVVEILPFANLFLRQNQSPPVQELRKACVALAIATDFNPGSAMCDDLMLAARLALTQGGFSINLALKAITSTGAQALGRSDIGKIKAGYKADIIITRAASINDFFYDWSRDLIRVVIKNGRIIV